MQRDGDIVAAGEVNGFHVEVIYRKPAMEVFYTWTATNDGKVHKTDGRDYPTANRAFDAAVEYIVPGAKAMNFKKPDAADYDALNALLYVGGLQEDLETIEDVVDLRQSFMLAHEAVAAVMVKSAKGMEQARLIIASTHGPFHEATMNVGKIAGIFDAQCAVLQQIVERSIETIDAFLSHLSEE